MMIMGAGLQQSMPESSNISITKAKERNQNENDIKTDLLFSLTPPCRPMMQIKNEIQSPISWCQEDFIEKEGLDHDVDTVEVLRRIESFAEWFTEMVNDGMMPDVHCQVPNSDDACHLSLVGRHPDSAERYARMCAVLNICHEVLSVRSRITLREVYYTLKPLDIFAHRAERKVNNAIRDAITLLKVPRAALGINITARGLIFGPVQAINEARGSLVVDGSRESSLHGHPIPGDVSLFKGLSFRILHDVKAIIIIEKEAVFQHIVLDPSVGGSANFILITGKGVPDLATRAFLSSLHRAFPCIPIFCLIDWNPSGIMIMMQYKFGSAKMAESSEYAIDDIKWLGIRSNLLKFVDPETLQPLSGRDFSMISTLQETLRDTGIISWTNELELMASSGTKAEIEAVYDFLGGRSKLGAILVESIVNEDYL